MSYLIKNNEYVSALKICKNDEEVKALTRHFALQSVSNFVFFTEVKDENGIVIIKDNNLYKRVINAFEEKSNLLIALPRRFAKSLLASLYSCYFMLKYPNKSITLISNVDMKSKKMLRGIRKLFSQNPFITEIFGDDLLSETGNNEHEITLRSRTTTKKEPNLLSTSILKPPQGWRSDLVIFDDIISHNYAESPTIKETVDTNFRMFFPLLEKEGKIIYIGTRYGANDIIQQIDESKQEWIKIIEGIYDKDGNLYSDIITQEEVDKRKLELTIAMFTSQYLNQYIIAGESVFENEKYKRYEDNVKFVRTIFGIDLSVAKSKDSDYSTIVCVGIDEFNKMYLIDCYYGKNTLSDFYQKIKEMYLIYKPDKVVVEDISAFYLEYEFFAKQTVKDGSYIPFMELSSQTKAKEKRIEITLEPLLRNGTLLLPKYPNKNVEHLIDFEMYFFNRNRKNNEDDLLDAFEIAVSQLKQSVLKDVPIRNFTCDNGNLRGNEVNNAKSFTKW